MTELPPAEVQRRWQHQIVANNRLAAGNAQLRAEAKAATETRDVTLGELSEALGETAQLRALLTAARAYVSREASGVGGAEARALIGEIDRVLGRDGGG